MGSVYVLTNSSLKGLLKIGATQRTALERADELSANRTGLPTRFQVRYEVLLADGDEFEVEREVHSLLSEYRVKNNREFFRCSIRTAIEAIYEVMGIEPARAAEPAPQDLMAQRCMRCGVQAAVVDGRCANCGGDWTVEV